MPPQPPLTEEQQKVLQEKLKNMSPEQLLQLQKQQCIFCQIIAGKIPAKKLYEDEQCIAILDINPAAKGHMLLLPKEHYAIMPQVPPATIGYLFIIAKKLSQVQLRALKSGGTSVFLANGLAAGQKAQHFMLHLIPRKEGDGILAQEELILDRDERRKAAQAVRQRLNELLGTVKEVAEVPEKTPVAEPAPPPEMKKTARAASGKKKGRSTVHEETTEQLPAAEDDQASLDDIAALFK